MKPILVLGVLALACGAVLAKLPPLDDAAKAKAAETAAKAGWQAKVDGYLTCKVQDRVAATYARTAGKAPVSKASQPVVPASAVTATAAAAASAGKPAASGTPLAAAPPTACGVPGPFAYNAPEQKPLETSGAHSPAGNATSPPSVPQTSAEMAPAKKK